MISSKSSIDSSASIGKNVFIGDYCVIGKNVKIEDNCKLIHSVNIQANSTIGKNNVFYPYSSIGSIPQDLKFKGEESFLEVGDNNVFRESCTVSLGTEHGGLITKIGNNSLFMINSHVGHDCQIGNNVIIANNVALAGHCIINDEVIIGGNSAVLQFTNIGTGSMIAGMTGVDKDILPYSLTKGNRCYYENLNLIGLKRKGFTNKEIEDYKRIVLNIFNTDNLRNYVHDIKEDGILVNSLKDFIEKKNPNRDICRPNKWLP